MVLSVSFKYSLPQLLSKIFPSHALSIMVNMNGTLMWKQRLNDHITSYYFHCFNFVTGNRVSRQWEKDKLSNRLVNPSFRLF